MRRVTALLAAATILVLVVLAAPAHATIVFVCGDMDKRRRAVKQVMTQAQVVKCGVIESDADAASKRFNTSPWPHAGADKNNTTSPRNDPCRSNMIFSLPTERMT